MIRKIVGVAFLIGCVLYLGASYSAAAKPQSKGAFHQATFTPPDFANGDTATVQLGDSRLFTAVCSCARQPGNVFCYGSVILDVDDTPGWDTDPADLCTAGEGESCSATFNYSFGTAGTFQFRVVCDEDDGSDALQDPAEAVTIVVEDTTPACTTGHTRPCPLQEGVCFGSEQLCNSGEWLPCDYELHSENFQLEETSCDSLDNDCDGRVDFVDGDGDGFGICPGPGVINELFLTDSIGYGSIEIYEYHNGRFEEAWSNLSIDASDSGAGGEAGDLTGDNIPEIAIQRIVGTSANKLEVWSFNEAYHSWYRMWESPVIPGYGLRVGDIFDADGDGLNELLVSEREAKRLSLYSFDGSGFSVEKVVQECPNNRGALFIATSGDIDGNGKPEILFQCDSPHDVFIREYGEGEYNVVGQVPVPYSPYGTPMIIDDMETGDVNWDGRADAVFCGNSGQVHVLTYRDEAYSIEFTSPPPSEAGVFSQTCSIGDVTNDGWNDIVVVNQDAIRVFSFDGMNYYEVWSEGPVEAVPGLGSSFVGDADNDGRDEFLWGRPIGAGYHLYESDDDPAATFSVTADFGAISGGGTIIIGNLNPANDTAPLDCDDSDPTQGAFEICGDGADNNCLGDVDEGCEFSFCGDNICGGSAEGETCATCSDDCGCFGPNCKHGCCGDGVCGRREDVHNCPVDCS